MSDFATHLAEISRFVSTLDLGSAAEAEAALNQSFPPEGEAMRSLTSEAETALAQGEICNRANGAIQYSRIVKPDADPGSCSIDAVLMADCSGPAHTHTEGEVCICIPRSGTPNFDGRSDFWVVMPKGSRHEPTVSEGAMLILYWWPHGAVQWG